MSQVGLKEKLPESMLFLIDANIPYSAKEIFPKRYKVIHVRDINLANASDEKVIGWARSNKAVLITRDFDFANILNFPPAKYFGILVLKIPSFYSASDIKRVLLNFIAKIDKITITKSTIIVEETRFRIKRED